MKDIAARAKVSVAAVSLALRDSKLIAPATRARLKAVAVEMGYTAHPYVSAYMSWRRSRGALRSPSIALIHPYATDDGWRRHGSASVREMHRGVAGQVSSYGYTAQEFRLGAERPERLVDILRARGITGLVFAPVAERSQSYDFPWEEFSAVQIGTGPFGVELPRVAHHHYHGALCAVRRCAERGFRRPGLVLDREHDQRLGHVWRAGFEMGAEECGFGRKAVWLMSERRPDLPSLRAWMRRHKVDVIVTNLHVIVERLIRDLGLSVPGDLGMVSLSVPAMGDRVTGMEQNSALIGTRAIDLLAGALQLHRTGLLREAITTLVNGRWNPGETI